MPNADGTQTLTWTITDVPVGQNMDVIHYSVNVVTTGDKDKDVPTGTTNFTLYYTTDTTYAGKTINEINKTAITENWSNVAIDPAGDGTVTAMTYESGRYKFTYLPAGTFAVKFGDGTTQTISNYIASPANRDGVNDALDSDGIATYSSDRSQLLKTVITGIEMPKAEEMPVVCLESKYHDSGFYERGYELPKSGGAGAERYTVGGFLMFTCAAFL